MEEPTKGTPISEPEKTGVQPIQTEAAIDFVIVRSEEKSYGSMSEMLAVHYLRSGIEATAIPLLRIYEQRSEERLNQVDNERRDALHRLSESVAENNRNQVLVAQLRERLAGGHFGRIGEQILTTVGAAALGAGIADFVSVQRPIGYVLTIVGAQVDEGLSKPHMHRSRARPS